MSPSNKPGCNGPIQGRYPKILRHTLPTRQGQSPRVMYGGERSPAQSTALLVMGPAKRMLFDLHAPQ